MTDEEQNGESPEESRWREAMAAAQAGDQDAYARLLTEILPVVRRWVRARVYDLGAVEDVVQNALLNVHRARHTYLPERRFRPWLRAVVRNAVTDSLRESGRRRAREFPVDDMEEFSQPTPPTVEPQSLSPEMRQALATLPGKQRQAVELIQIEGLSVAAAALRAGVSTGALKVRAHRGYRALRAVLELRRP